MYVGNFFVGRIFVWRFINWKACIHSSAGNAEWRDKFTGWRDTCPITAAKSRLFHFKKEHICKIEIPCFTELYSLTIAERSAFYFYLHDSISSKIFLSFHFYVFIFFPTSINRQENHLNKIRHKNLMQLRRLHQPCPPIRITLFSITRRASQPKFLIARRFFH